MKETRVSARYASALIELALEKNLLEKVKEDMKAIHDIFAQSSDFRIMVGSPLIKADKKISIFREIFKGKVTDLTLSFLELVTKKGRESHLHEITSQFNSLYNEHKGMQMAIVTTAVGLDNELKKKVLAIVKEQTKSEVELIEKVDKNLIGGFTLKFGDNLIDSSIARSLKKLKRNFSDNPNKKEQ